MTAGSRAVVRILAAPLIIYLMWLAMLLLHETGHALHAWLGGGTIREIRIPLLGFSQTFVNPNPNERFTVLGGPLWGVLLPLIACGMIKLIRKRPYEWTKFLAGFCLIANGAYIAIGWTLHAGDAHDLTRLGVPVWALVIAGSLSFVCGMIFWHHSAWLSRRASVSLPPAA